MGLKQKSRKKIAFHPPPHGRGLLGEEFEGVGIVGVSENLSRPSYFLFSLPGHDLLGCLLTHPWKVNSLSSKRSLLCLPLALPLTFRSSNISSSNISSALFNSSLVFSASSIIASLCSAFLNHFIRVDTASLTKLIIAALSLTAMSLISWNNAELKRKVTLLQWSFFWTFNSPISLVVSGM